MSGGGRGIGFALAETLCRAHGCRVIVSGRGPAPDPGAVLNTMSEPDFLAYRDRRLIDAVGTDSLANVRAKLARARWDRELYARLAEAEAAGLDIVYRQCDVTDPDQVRALIDAAGPRLIGVVHNAGVDAPVRIPAKTRETIRRTVSVKVVGLLNLLRACTDVTELRFFHTTGSVSGRWGGMVGQLEYGAANEALSRIGHWAAAATAQAGRQRRVPVTTMCWPTWERLGNITNYEATLAYMSAMNVVEGLHHWHREILAGGYGERSFVGELGAALLPNLLRGFPPSHSLPAMDVLANRAMFLGAPVRFASGKLLESTLDADGNALPCCSDFRVDGAPAIPISLLLEYLRSLGDWVRPDSGAREPLTAMHAVAVDIEALRLDAGQTRFHARAEGEWAEGDRWQVRVQVSKADGRRVGTATLRYGAESTAARRDPLISPEHVTAASPHRLDWGGHVFRLGHWSIEPGAGVWTAQVEGDRMTDLVALAPVPRSVLPLNQVETMIRGAYLRQVPVGPSLFELDSLDICSDTVDSAGTVTGDGTRWAAGTPAGDVRIVLRNPRFTEGGRERGGIRTR
nr:SDR family NAD(P)-dependent oxidoreductase [Nocardia bovistercoris]